MKPLLSVIASLSLLMLACPAHAQELLFKKWVNIFFDSQSEFVKLDSASIRNKLKEPKLAEVELYFFNNNSICKETYSLYDMELQPDTVEEMHHIDYQYVNDSIRFAIGETIKSRSPYAVRIIDDERRVKAPFWRTFDSWSMKVIYLDHKCLALQSENHIHIYFSKADATERDYVKYILLIQSMLR